MPNPRPLQTARELPMTAKTWTLPLTCAVIGLGYLVVGLLGHDGYLATVGPALMFGLAAVLLAVRRRSETVQGLTDRRDERINSLDLQATAITGVVLVVAILIGFGVSIAQGDDGTPFVWLGALGGVTYVAALVVLRMRG